MSAAASSSKGKTTLGVFGNVAASAESYEMPW